LAVAAGGAGGWAGSVAEDPVTWAGRVRAAGGGAGREAGSWGGEALGPLAGGGRPGGGAPGGRPGQLGF